MIDFDNVSYYNEPLVKDIVILLMYACRESLHSSRLDINKAKFVIKEYNKYRKLSKKEIELIPDLATAGAIEDFSYVYWLFKNDKKRAKLYRLRLYAETAIWFKMHKMKIIEILL